MNNIVLGFSDVKMIEGKKYTAFMGTLAVSGIARQFKGVWGLETNHDSRAWFVPINALTNIREVEDVQASRTREKLVLVEPSDLHVRAEAMREGKRATQKLVLG